MNFLFLRWGAPSLREPFIGPSPASERPRRPTAAAEKACEMRPSDAALRYYILEEEEEEASIDVAL